MTEHLESFEYFNVVLIDRKTKTQVYELVSRHGESLGIIKWFGRWRQYCFFPEEETVFSKGCLQDIQTVLNNRNQEHRIGERK